ncbi:MAG: phospholipase D family protein [Castellaniella sp.]
MSAHFSINETLLWTLKGLLILIAALLTACGPPALQEREASLALTTQEGSGTLLGQALAPLAGQHVGLSGVVPLSDSLDAFAARMLLIATAQRTIDARYYIWRDDITGNLLLDALHDAARRGVRVRLLVDDNGTSGLDDRLALLNAQANAEVRLFNPFPFRAFKPLWFLTDFRRLNRRMHNKSLTIDGQATVVGGRNIGDEYFGATQDVAFADLDIMAVGTVVDEVSHDFDRYWNSQSAYPIEQLVTAPDTREAQALEKEEAGTLALPKAQAYLRVVRTSGLVEDLLAQRLAFYWAPVRMVSDDPAKVLGKAQPQTMLTARLMEILETPTRTIDLISPYFVPTQQGVQAFGQLADQGVAVRILTNALEATDVAAVHAGYMKYRKPLLERGIALFEMRGNHEVNKPREKAGPFGSSGTSLHAKTFSVDGERLFVGSFNFDPRSARLNTELGFVIESEQLADRASRAFDNMIPRFAYQLEQDAEHGIVWIDRSADNPVRLTTEPSASFWKRLAIRFLSRLPIESLL